jgi:putative transposase
VTDSQTSSNKPVKNICFESTATSSCRTTLAIQILKQRFSRTQTEDYVWEPRYYDFNVFSEAKRIEKLRYMHRNPVKAGLVEQPEDWPWSSFRAYAKSEPHPVLIAT